MKLLLLDRVGADRRPLVEAQLENVRAPLHWFRTGASFDGQHGKGRWRSAGRDREDRASIPRDVAGDVTLVVVRV